MKGVSDILGILPQKVRVEGEAGEVGVAALPAEVELGARRECRRPPA